MFRIQFQRLAVILNGLVPLSFAGEGQSQIMIRGGEVRLKLNCFEIICDGLIEATNGLIEATRSGGSISKITVSLGVIRRQSQRFDELPAGVVQFSVKQKCRTEIDVDGQAFGIYLKSLFIAVNAVRNVFVRDEMVSEIFIRCQIVLCNRDRMTK